MRALFFDVGLVGRAVGSAAFVLLLSGRTVASDFTLAVASAVASAIMFAAAPIAVSTIATSAATATVCVGHCDGIRAVLACVVRVSAMRARR